MSMLMSTGKHRVEQNDQRYATLGAMLIRIKKSTSLSRTGASYDSHHESSIAMERKSLVCLPSCVCVDWSSMRELSEDRYT